MKDGLTARELRAAWALLAVPLGVVFWLPNEARVLWISVTALPWLLGVALLAGGDSAARAAQNVGLAVSDTSLRISAVVILLLLFLIDHVFSLSAALFVLIWGGLALLILAARCAAVRFRAVILAGMTTAAALGVALLATEFVLRSPAVAKRLGPLDETAAWRDRYDSLSAGNIFGFRSRYETVESDSAIRRIAVLGDSFTWGDKIAKTDSTWPALLEDELRRRLPGGGVEVINMAQRGYTTANEAEVLRRLGWQFEPSVVIIQFFVNDALPSGPNLARRGGEWLMPRRSILPARFRSGSVASSALLGLLEGRLNALLNGSRPYLRFEELYREDAHGWRQARDAMREIAESAASREVPALLVLFPHLVPGSWSPETYPLREIHAKVAAHAEAVGFHVLDLTVQFAERGGDWRRWWATPYDSHPGLAAHAAAAVAIADELLAKGLFPIAAANLPQNLEDGQASE